MMRGRVQPNWEEDDPDVKRARFEAEEEVEGSQARVRKAMEEQQRALVRLTEERRSEVRQLEESARAIQFKLVEARRKLADTEAQLACVQNYFQSNAGILKDSVIKVKTESEGEPDSMVNAAAPSSIMGPIVPGLIATSLKREEPDLRILGDSVNSNALTLIATSLKSEEPDVRILGDSVKSNASTLLATSLKREEPDLRILGDWVKSNVSTPMCSRSSNATHTESDMSETTQKLPKACQMMDMQAGSIKFQEEKAEMKLQGEGFKEHEDLASQVCGNYALGFLNIVEPNYIASQHRRKLRSLVVNPFEYKICATSALDGIINIWQIEGDGIGLSRTTTLSCLSPEQRRWPEDIAWDPTGNKLIACYTADGKDNQVAIIEYLSKRVEFLEDKPHDKGIIHSIIFMPWNGGSMFATGGSDHGVVIWTKEDAGIGWKPRLLHRSLHSSAVMGVTGIPHKEWVISAGADKCVIGYDVSGANAAFRYRLESKAMAVLPNPADFNLFMIQTGAPGKQLRLFDIRVKPSEHHAFGWIQESSESQSALISQTWSPDGCYIVSGSADPKIHVFDIRYNSKEPSQTVKAHKKRVFKAAWHHKMPLLISISSDLNIGLHRLVF